MEWLNYHHLYYFWTVFNEGSVSGAAVKLKLSQPTVSSQIKALEESIGERLFQKEGRRLALTEPGKLVFRYAGDIFSAGREMLDTMRGRPTGKPLRFRVGIADAVPKMIAYRLLKPVFGLNQPIQLICHEDKSERLLAELAVHGLDMVLSDMPVPPFIKVKAYNHLLASYGISIMGAGKLLTKKRKPRFPHSLDGAPFLMPASGTSLRQSLDQWFESQGISPKIVGEFDDSALMKVFGEGGTGYFAVADILEKEVSVKYRVNALGRIPEVRENFYAISADRKLKHPAVAAIAQTARQKKSNQ